MEKYKVELTFTEQVLGATPKSKKVYASYIANKKPKPLIDDELEEELETVEDLEEKGWTGFHMQDGQPLIRDYMIKGFFKDACSMLRRVSGTESSKLRAHKKIIDGLVFVYPKRIPLNLHEGEMDVLERPLRGQTAKGERVTLARSDTCPAGTTMAFTLVVFTPSPVTETLLREWLDYGRFRGLRQWRNAGYGRFTYSLVRA